MVRPVRCPVARRFHSVALLAVVAMALLLAGCLGTGDDSAKLQQQARTALTRWADAVAAAGPSPVVLVGELTGQVGVWEPAVGDNNKRALMAGLVEADASLPATTPPDGEVRWQDGTTAPVASISRNRPSPRSRRARQSRVATTARPCGSTALLLTTSPIETSRGHATAPTWDLTVEGTAVTVTRAAIADAIAIELPPWNPFDPAIGLPIELASVTADGRQLTVAFVGARCQVIRRAARITRPRRSSPMWLLSSS